MEKKTNTFKIDFALEFKLYEISEKTVDISLPADAVVIGDVFGCYYNWDEGVFNYMEIESNGGKIDITVYGYDADFNDIFIYAHGLSADVLASDKIWLEGAVLEFYFNDELIPHDKSTDLIMEIDADDESFRLISVPDYGADSAGSL